MKAKCELKLQQQQITKFKKLPLVIANGGRKIVPSTSWEGAVEKKNLTDHNQSNLVLMAQYRMTVSEKAT